MGEKPMGTPVDEEELDPMAGAGAINTTRSNIKNQAGVADAGGTGAETVDAPEPGGGGETSATSINTTRDNIKTQGVAGAAQPGGPAGVTGDPIPEIDAK